MKIEELEIKETFEIESGSIKKWETDYTTITSIIFKINELIDGFSQMDAQASHCTRCIEYLNKKEDRMKKHDEEYMYNINKIPNIEKRLFEIEKTFDETKSKIYGIPFDLKKYKEEKEPEELKPLNCPFCNQIPFIKRYEIDYLYKWEIGCNGSHDYSDCSFRPMKDGFDSLKEAIESWNKRSK